LSDSLDSALPNSTFGKNLQFCTFFEQEKRTKQEQITKKVKFLRFFCIFRLTFAHIYGIL